MNSQTFNVSMPKQLVERIDAQTKRQGSSRSDFVRLAVRKQLAILEQWDSLSNKVRSQYKDKQLSEDEVVKVVRSYRAK